MIKQESPPVRIAMVGAQVYGYQERNKKYSTMADNFSTSTESPERAGASTPGDAPLFEIRKVSKWFGSIKALQEVDLDIRQGEVLGLLGDNGAGKSTLVKIISGIHQPTAGTIRSEGKEVQISSPHVAHSGGQRQAVAIARAIRWKAKLVILDEPTAALSVPEQQKVLSLTRQLASKGVGVIYITHNILDVMAVTDRLAILHRGRKAAEVATKDTTEHEIVSLLMGKTTR